MVVDWNKIKKDYPDPNIQVELRRLYELKGNGKQTEINKQRLILRNLGFISLPFSMNKKK